MAFKGSKQWYTKDRYTGQKILKPGLKLIGAKTRIRDLLYQQFPSHNVYIEPFMGTAGVLIGKPKVQVEMSGDLNSYVINFYECMQEDPEGLWKEISYRIPIMQQVDDLGDENVQLNKKQFEYHRSWVTKTYDALEQAAMFYLVTKCCMNGIWRLNQKGECNSSFCGTTFGRGYYTREWFDKVAERIKSVKFKHCSYDESLWFAQQMADAFGREDAFCFLDPPYHDCKTTYNGIGWGDGEFLDLAVYLHHARFNWLLTINDDPFIRDVFQGYFTIPHQVHYSCSQTNAGRGKKPELLIANYPLKDFNASSEETSAREEAC